MNSLIILFGKIISLISKLINLGHGSTWPGHIALSLNPHFIADTCKNSPTKIVIIAGTNGKTTTSKLLQTILENNRKTVIRNISGANLLNGIASTLLLNAHLFGKIFADYTILEVDENILPLLLKQLTPSCIILLNLFRDQLDRYGEVNTIAAKWKDSIKNLSSTTTLILNADDPLLVTLSQNTHAKSLFFGLDKATITLQKTTHASDSIYCTNCGAKLMYKKIFYSHLGIWECPKCKEKRPVPSLTSSQLYPLAGIYNRYNTLAAVLTAQKLGIPNEKIYDSLLLFEPAFGRQEIIEYEGKQVRLFLSKNPTSFNESLRTITELGAKTILFVLNDRVPDGRDVSWIWDIDFEDYLKKNMNVTVSGDRVYDMALRITYSFQISNFKSNLIGFKFQIEENLQNAVMTAIQKTAQSEILYILPTYSAMLEVRKILTGKKIL